MKELLLLTTFMAPVQAVPDHTPLDVHKVAACTLVNKQRMQMGKVLCIYNCGGKTKTLVARFKCPATP